MRCDICHKRRKTEFHYRAVPTADNQDIDYYDTTILCIECSRKQYHWSLSCGYKIKGNRFIPELLN